MFIIIAHSPTHAIVELSLLAVIVLSLFGIDVFIVSQVGETMQYVHSSTSFNGFLFHNDV